MSDDDELAQRNLEVVNGRVVKAIEYLMSAHVAATRAAEYRPSQNYTALIQHILDEAELLRNSLTQAVGEYVPHRGLRTPPACGNDIGCPVHGLLPHKGGTCLGPRRTLDRADPTDIGASRRTCPQHGGRGNPNAPCLCKFVL